MNAMMYIEAPTEYVADGPSIFLAGGISEADNWQPWMAKQFEGSGLSVLNPRRHDFPDDPAAAEQQIDWEFRHLRKATARLFWFPPQTLCPIALYELGAASATTVPLFVGVHPEYKRKQDVVFQLQLARSDVQVVFDLDELAQQAIGWASELQMEGQQT